ncbi:high mobility group box domain-containing protein [Xylariaceae sp. AK1471]|nr:high mobility group box domain-containing protein [Xylariaceae sp. AK1471]
MEEVDLSIKFRDLADIVNNWYAGNYTNTPPLDGRIDLNNYLLSSRKRKSGTSFVVDLHRGLARKWRTHGSRLKQLWRSMEPAQRTKAMKAGAAEGVEDQEDGEPLPKKAHIKKSENCWILFRKVHHDQVAKQHPNMPFGSISQILSDRWKDMTKEQRKPYEDEADRLAAEHRILYPDYKIAPARKPTENRPRREHQW